MSTYLDSRWILQGHWKPALPDQFIFSHIATDTRRLFQPGQTLFFCLRGSWHDGHTFIAEAFRQGIRTVVVDHVPEHLPVGMTCLVVPDTLLALQELAKAYRSTWKGHVTGITGSNGKTSIKEWLYTLLKETIQTGRSPKSYNSQVGVPLSLTGMDDQAAVYLIEAGISEPGEMRRLATMIAPNSGILTSLGSAHDAGFPDRITKLKEKLLLFQSCAWVIAPQEVVASYPSLFYALPSRCLTWSEGEDADLVLQHWEESTEGQKITYRYQNEEETYFLPHGGVVARRNSAVCLLYALQWDIPRAQLHAGMGQLPALTMRLETREGWQGNLIISDHYNADLDALRLALDYFNQRKGTREGWLILSELDQTGLSNEAMAVAMAHMLEQVPVQRVTFIGQSAPQLAEKLTSAKQVNTYADTASFLKEEQLEHTHHTAILLKGARRYAFEEISRRLVRYSHRTILEINTSALSHNLHHYARHIRPGTRTMVMVKASAYGGGGPEIARWLALQRVDYLGVAFADEGVELRKAGISLPILVLNPDEPAFPLIVEYQLEPEIHSTSQLRQFIHFLSPADPVISIHIKLETGMHRLGFEAHELPGLIQQLRNCDQIRVASIFSHLSASESAEHDGFTREQAGRFESLAHQIESAIGYHPLHHLVNSSGILRFPEYQYDMVRIGIGLYGLDQAASADGVLRPAIALRSRVSRIHKVPSGDGVGYGRRGEADRERTIATISIGYADGLLRLAGEGRFQFRVGEGMAPTVGSICMDMTMLDVTHLSEVQIGDEVVVFDERTPIDALATALQTIPYEVLTNISPRVSRVYVED